MGTSKPPQGLVGPTHHHNWTPSLNTESATLPPPNSNGLSRREGGGGVRGKCITPASFCMHGGRARRPHKLPGKQRRSSLLGEDRATQRLTKTELGALSALVASTEGDRRDGFSSGADARSHGLGALECPSVRVLAEGNGSFVQCSRAPGRGGQKDGANFKNALEDKQLDDIFSTLLRAAPARVHPSVTFLSLRTYVEAGGVSPGS